MPVRTFSPALEGKTIGCIGCGNMGGAILSGLANFPELHLLGYNRTASKLEHLANKGIAPIPDIPSIAAKSDLLIIGVKPHFVESVLTKALPTLRPETVIISIAAGISVTAI